MAGIVVHKVIAAEVPSVVFKACDDSLYRAAVNHSCSIQSWLMEGTSEEKEKS